MEIDISVCIVNWNTKDLLYECIKSIKEHTSGVTYEIIIVDNNSKDESVAMIRESYPECILIKSDKNLGFSKGNNMAASAAKGRYILYLNPDTLLTSNALHAMFQFLEQDKAYGAVGSKLVNPDGSIQYICARTFPTPLNQLNGLLLLNRIFPNSKFFSTIEIGYWDHLNSREIDCLSGACIMIRRNVTDQLNGFDETIFMYADDVDLCYRIKKAGWKIYYLASESIIHLEGSSSKQKANRHFSTVLQRASNYYFIKKHFGHIKAFWFRLAVCLGSALRILITTIFSPVLIVYFMKKRVNPFHLLNKYCQIFFWSVGFRNNRVK